MLYPYITLVDGTEIMHTHVFEEDGLKKVEVHFERPKEGGFDTARCQLPSYKWLTRDGFTDEEIRLFDQLVRSNAHLFYKYGANGGVKLGGNMCDKEEALNEALEKGYQSVLAGRCRAAKDVFDELDRGMDAYYSNKSIKAPIAMGSLTQEELDAEIAKGMDSVRNGRGFTDDEVDNMLKKDFGI